MSPAASPASPQLPSAAGGMIPVVLPALPPATSSSLPLRGLTVLVVEDSRYASEALRLMCQRSGARPRRAESLCAAASHLGTYRPDVVIVDLGLPDGCGEDLIRSLGGRLGRAAGGLTDGPLVLGMSGDPDGRTRAVEAGAADFFAKPLPDLAGFQTVILSHLGDRYLRSPPIEGEVSPDPLALCDDLRMAEAALKAGLCNAKTRDWLRGFLAGLALQSGDGSLRSAAEAVGRAGDATPIRDIIADKIRQMPPFGQASRMPGQTLTTYPGKPGPGGEGSVGASPPRHA